MYELVLQTYFEKFNAIIAKVNERLEKYIADPNEKNVHDLRTSIRRLDLAWRIIPSNSRKQKMTKFVILRKKFFRANSQIRDMDIIRQKVTAYSTDDASQIIKKIDKQKQDELKSARKKAEIASRIMITKIEHDDKISQEKLEKRFKKITLNMINNIETAIPIVVKSDKKVKQLHELRKDCKKLRYLLEMTNHDESSNFMSKLREMQDLLGLIRDSDITIDFLRGFAKKYKSLELIIKDESEKRDQMYKKFVQMQKF